MSIAMCAANNELTTRYSLLSRLHDWDDQESWREFFETYWGLIYSVATRAGLRPAEAQDVVQETVICVARDIHKFRRDHSLGSFRGWLRNIVRWRIADYFRKQGRIHPLGDNAPSPEDWVQLDEIPESSAAGADALWDEEWKTHVFNAAIDCVKRKVREEQYQMFNLYVIQQLPAAEVARRLSVTIGHVYVAKHRISALIKKEIQRLEAGLY
jgi:RNA polymerase sigma factor (sigma-70 family)